MDMTIRDILNRAAESGKGVFAEFPESKNSLSFGTLNTQTRSVGQFLKNKGIARGKNIGLLMRNGEEMTKFMLGIMSSGYVAMPVNPHDTIERIRYILEYSETGHIFILDEFREAAESAAAGIKKKKIEIVSVDKMQDEVFGLNSSGYKEKELASDQGALLLYTSGSTGRPKGVLLTHRNLIANARYVAEAHLLKKEDKALCVLPLYHINGFVVTVITPLLTKGSVIMPHKFSVKNFWHLISDYKATWTSVIPTILAFILHAHEEGKINSNYDSRSLRFIRSASMMLPVEIQKQFERRFKHMIVETLGLTETAGQVFSNPRKRSLRKYGSVGIPYGNKVKVINDLGKALKDMCEGEIAVKGENVMSGYYKNEEQTKAAFINGWFRTGDIGYRDEDGYYFITGRKKELINRSGEKISPVEIDNVLYSHPLVKEAATVGVPDVLYGEEVRAFIVLKKDAACSEEEIIEFCKENLADYKCPKTVEFVHKLPKGPSGKVQRLRLKDKEGGKHGQAVSHREESLF